MGSIGTQAQASRFSADVCPAAPEDPLFGLMAAYRKDTSDKKIDLGIGAYRDNNAKPWVLPVVKKVCEARHTYLNHTDASRLMIFSEPIPTSTTNISPLPVCRNSHLRRRN